MLLLQLLTTACCLGPGLDWTARSFSFKDKCPGLGRVQQKGQMTGPDTSDNPNALTEWHHSIFKNRPSKAHFSFQIKHSRHGGDWSLWLLLLARFVSKLPRSQRGRDCRGTAGVGSHSLPIQKAQAFNSGPVTSRYFSSHQGN